jgi:hypothetical protein
VAQDGEPRFFTHNEPMTINEFKAFCDRALPGLGVCGMGWGEELLDEHGNLRQTSSIPFAALLASQPIPTEQPRPSPRPRQCGRIRGERQ